MVLEISRDGPWWLRAAADLLLAAHIGGGVVGLVSGTLALCVPKGRRAHRIAGKVFVVSMLLMAAIGTAVAPFLPQRGSVLAGAFTFYLVITAWMTVKRPAGRAGAAEFGALALAVIIATFGIGLGNEASGRPDGQLEGSPALALYVFAGLAAFAAAMDLRRMTGSGRGEAARVARHLWRMCVALLIAAISLFLGQQQVFPAGLRGSPWLMLPEVGVLVLLAYWLARMRRWRGAGVPVPAHKVPAKLA